MKVFTEHVLKHIFTDFGSFLCHVIFYRKSKAEGGCWFVAAFDKKRSHIR